MPTKELCVWRKNVLVGVSERLRSRGHDGHFAVSHGISNGGSLGRDVDFIVNPHCAVDVVGETIEYLRQRGFQVACLRFPYVFLVFCVDVSSGMFSLEMDFATCYYWTLFKCISVSAPVDTYNVCGIPCAKTEAFIKRILLQFLSGNIHRYKRNEKARDFKLFSEEQVAVDSYLAKVFGSVRSQELTEALRTVNWEWFKRNKWRYRGLFAIHGLRNDWMSMLSALVSRVRREWYFQFSKQVTPDVVLVGPFEALEQYYNQVVSILDSNYIFSAISMHRIFKIDDIASAKRYTMKSQRLLSLHCFLLPETPSWDETSTRIVVDISRTPPERAAVQVVVKHLSMIGCPAFRI